MKTSLSLLPILFGAALATYDTTIANNTQPNFSALALKYEELTSSFLSKALDRLDEREKSVPENGEQPTCTRDNLVLRKE